MKRLVIILFIVAYLAGLSRSVLSFHYCGGSFKYITVNTIEEKPSCCEGEMEEDGCCSDELVTLSVDDHQQTGKILHWFKSLETAVLHPNYFLLKSPVYGLSDIPSTGHSPPLLHAPPLYIFYCVFRI